MFLVNGDQLVSELFDVSATSDNDDDLGDSMGQPRGRGHREVRLPLNVGILGEVASTGITANVMDAYSVSATLIN